MARIAFIQYFWIETLGLMYISSLLKKSGHQTILCMNDRRQIKKKLPLFKPDIVAFQCATGMQRWVNDTAGFIKKEINRDILIIVGGPHPTFFPEVIEEKNIDIICQGEGEYPMLDLTNKLDAKEQIIEIKNLWVKVDGKVFKNAMRPLIQDLDRLPFPDRELYRESKFIFNSPYHHFITSRGCPYDCTFCYNHIFRGMQDETLKYVRRRSVDNVIEELLECKRNYKLESINFLDDTLNLMDKDWMFEFLDKYRKNVKIPFFCMVRANLIDEELVKKLKDSGCFWITMGVETGNEDYRNKMLRKNLKNSQIINTASLLHKYKLHFHTTNIMGLPGETLEDAIQTLRFNSGLKPTVVWCSLFQPYPRTELGEYCLKNGLIHSLDGDSIDVHSHTLSYLKQKDIREITNLHKFSHIAVKFPILMPLIRNLLRLPPNKLFLYLYRFNYLIFYWAKINKINVKRIIQEAIIAFRYYREEKPLLLKWRR